ncbi:hypothetical protein HN51_043393 [Arachis hypogaea]
MGCSGGLALAIAVLLKAIFTAEEMPLSLWMFPSGADAGSEASVNQPPDRNGAGPSNAAPADSPQGSFPSVPPCLQPLPSNPSVPSVPSLPSVEENNLVGREQPVQQLAEARFDWEKYQHDKIAERLSVLTPNRARDTDTVDAIILLKRDILDRMAQLDPNPFWAEQRNELVANGILNKGAEYTIETLQKKLEKLEKDGINSAVFKDLEKLHPDIHNE